MIRIVGLSERLDDKVRQLSGGQARRVEIARALAADPSFLLLDEPFAGVDPIATEDIQNIVRGVRDRGIGVLITDHNASATLRLTERRQQAGDIAELDVARVRTEVAATESEALALDQRRATLEHALAVLVAPDAGPDAREWGAVVCIGLATEGHVVTRRARLTNGRDWVRQGATEMGLDCLRRLLLGLPVEEPVDFEQRG